MRTIKMEPSREDSIRVEITDDIHRAAVVLLGAVIREIRHVWPEATDADRRRVGINVMLAYWGKQAEGFDVKEAHLIRFPFPKPSFPMLAEVRPDEVARLPLAKQQHFAALTSLLITKLKQKQFYDLFPDADRADTDGSVLIYRRDLYPKHLEFFDAGNQYRERCFLAANRVGKTTCGSYELTCHLTGLYPKWWTGKIFHGPVRAWACGRRNETTRDIVQASLLGPVAYEGMRKVLAGTGMVPGGLIGRVTWKRGVEDLIDTCKVRHVAGGWSTLGMKSYEQGRGSFEGTSQHCIWLDEECPEDVYGECLIRLMTTQGILMITFTPLEGMTKTVQQFQLVGDRAVLGRM